MLHDPEVTLCRDFIDHVLNGNVVRRQTDQAIIIDAQRQFVFALVRSCNKRGETAKDQQPRPQGEHVVSFIRPLRPLRPLRLLLHSLRLR